MSLVQIGKKQKAEGEGVSRRSFLKVLGATTAATVATGCADPHQESIFPNVKKQDNQVPGVAVWYSSTCRECSAGCGIQVRTREGRAVKVEGNPDHPTNKGGLCGLGQSSLQALYDPDRVREPLERTTDSVTGKTVYKPIAWTDALGKVAGALVEPGKKKFMITGETNGTLDSLLQDFSKGFGVDRVTFDPMDEVDLAEASERVYGTYGIPSYKFDRADVLVSFGADFLETWISPCEYARDWAAKRRSEKPQTVFQIEPRMSLTGAKADKWISINPGTEVRLALAILKTLLTSSGKGLDSDTSARLSKLVKDVDLYAVSKETGVSVEKILLIASRLSSASETLVVAGGAQGRSANGVGLQVVCAFINVVLGNIGRSVQLTRMRKPKTYLSAMTSAISEIADRKASLVMFQGTNPIFTLPSAYNLKTALEKVKPGLVVSFSSHLDETTAIADIILPIHHDLEDWGDHTPYEGVRGLLQPTMLPVFNTRSFGDLLLTLATAVDKKEVTGGHRKFQDYLKASWEKFYGSLGKSGDFAGFWRECVEKGGYFAPDTKTGGSASPSAKAFDVKFDAPEMNENGAKDGLTLVPFFSAQSFDGRAANRPWLQEIPDPLSLVVWDTWGEIHPETAKELSLSTGDIAKVQNFYGELNIPVVVTEQIKPGAIAVPIGQGHHEYGRFAKSIGGGNVFTMLPASEGSLSFIASRVSVTQSNYRNKIVRSQLTQDQMDRKIAQTEFLAPDGSVIKEHGHGEHHHGAPKQMYEQRKHPLYQWGMVIDLATCSGCTACIVACYAENNIPVVGKDMVSYGREMSWMQIHNYTEGEGEELTVSLQPMLCQHCQNAPCEPVCPVYATYHNEEGLNAMVYNRCVGTRYCSNNCSYKVRRFNWVEFEIPETYQWQLNPDVTRRTVGIMEKCTFCVQRINEAKDKAKDSGRTVQDGEVKPACVQSCPTQALTFGNLLDPESKVSQLAKDRRGYKVIDAFVNTQPSVTYLKDIKYRV